MRLRPVEWKDLSVPPASKDLKSYETPTTVGSWATDRVEFTSSTAIEEASRIEELRRQIAQGRYSTSDKLDVVVDRLFEALNAEAQREPVVA